MLQGGMFVEDDQKRTDVVCSRDTPSDITDVKGGKVSNLLSGYKDTRIQQVSAYFWKRY
jgi:hypothetical protein